MSRRKPPSGFSLDPPPLDYVLLEMDAQVFAGSVLGKEFLDADVPVHRQIGDRGTRVYIPAWAHSLTSAIHLVEPSMGWRDNRLCLLRYAVKHPDWAAAVDTAYSLVVGGGSLAELRAPAGELAQDVLRELIRSVLRDAQHEDKAQP